MSKVTKISSTRIQRQFERTAKVFIMLGLPDTVDHKSLVKCYLSNLERMEENWGTKECTKYLKALYTLYSQYSCKLKVNANEALPKWSKLDCFGMPVRYSPFTKAILTGDKLTIKYILSLIRIYEIITLEPDEDISTIVTETTGREGYLTFREDFRNFLRTNDLTQGIRQDFQKHIKELREETNGNIPFHTTHKSGTDGPALSNLHHQSLAVKGEVKQKLCKIVEHFYSEDYNALLEYNQYLASQLKSQDVFTQKGDGSKAKELLGVISFIPDKGGKTRVVAKANYWIQNGLLPLHKVCYRTLRNVSMDGTYRQSELFEYLMNLSTKEGVAASDMKAATDQFILEIQRDALEFLEDNLGEEWFELLRLLEFDFNGKPIKYGTGSPMGVYSSWGVFALTHHFLVLYCFSRSTQWNNRTKYGLLGDDNGIANKPANTLYREKLSAMQVKINLLKSWDPDRALGNNKQFEFAKRYALNGVEMTALPPGIIDSGFRQIYNIPEVVNFLVKHGYPEVLQVHLSSIFECYDVWKRNRQRLFVAFHISGAMGSSYVVSSITDNLQYDPGVSSMTLASLLNIRFNRLMKNILETATSKGEVEKRTSGLLTSLSGDCATYDLGKSAYSRVLETQKTMLSSFQRKMAMAIFEKTRAESLEILTTELEVKLLNDVEYSTPVSFEALRDGITRREEPIHLRGRILKELTQEALANRV